jgi:hypothetical protein
MSLKRIYQVLSDFPIVFVGPPGLNDVEYISDGQSIQSVDYSFLQFDDSYFKDVQGYNRLLCSTKFYKNLDQYDYILITQLDSYVFRNELLYWCGKGYDYIGGPWLTNKVQRSFYESLLYSRNSLISKIKTSIDYNKGHQLMVGNGGFSLRKVNSCRKISRWIKVLEPGLIKSQINEDLIWSILVPKFFKWFKIPPYQEALKFSFDSEPMKAFGLNERQLPFGCHGWSKKENIKFWSTRILDENI